MVWWRRTSTIEALARKLGAMRGWESLVLK
jgi:hypothetical protein